MPLHSAFFAKLLQTRVWPRRAACLCVQTVFLCASWRLRIKCYCRFLCVFLTTSYTGPYQQHMRIHHCRGVLRSHCGAQKHCTSALRGQLGAGSCPTLAHIRWALETAALESLERSKQQLRGHWMLGPPALEPQGAQNSCSRATGRSKQLLQNHWAPKPDAPEPLGTRSSCSRATGRSKQLHRSHWALEFDVTVRDRCWRRLCFTWHGFPKLGFPWLRRLICSVHISIYIYMYMLFCVCVSELRCKIHAVLCIIALCMHTSICNMQGWMQVCMYAMQTQMYMYMHDAMHTCIWIHMLMSTHEYMHGCMYMEIHITVIYNIYIYGYM